MIPASSICRRKDDLEIHDEIEGGPLLGAEKQSNNDTDCSHEEKEGKQSIGIDKDKTNQGMKEKHNTKVYCFIFYEITN